MPKQIVANIVPTLITVGVISIGVFVWERATDGSLIRALGGAVAEDITKRLESCEAFPREETQPFAQCRSGTFQLAEWCSGDCNADDARVTICCPE